jgi:hypothetical protein
MDNLEGTMAMVDDACVDLEDVHIPDSVIHNDLNTGNILVDNDRAVLIDWAEAYIGVPFVSFQHLRIQAKEKGLSPIDLEQLTSIYKQSWRKCLSEAVIERGLALIPPVAIISYVLGRDPTFTSPYRTVPVVQNFARTLARHLMRAVQEPIFQKTLRSHRKTASFSCH